MEGGNWHGLEIRPSLSSSWVFALFGKIDPPGQITRACYQFRKTCQGHAEQTIPSVVYIAPRVFLRGYGKIELRLILRESTFDTLPLDFGVLSVSSIQRVGRG
jgi:hypothetical protein